MFLNNECVSVCFSCAEDLQAKPILAEYNFQHFKSVRKVYSNNILSATVELFVSVLIFDAIINLILCMLNISPFIHFMYIGSLLK